MNQVMRLAIRQAFEQSDPIARVEAVKTAVCRFLAGADRSVEVRKTDYFNHTIVPDLLIRWPREQRERQVFLRPNPDPAWLAEDLRWITGVKPIMVALNGTEDAPFAPTEALGTAALAGDTLIADTAALEEVGTGTDPGSSLLSHALLRGGRGALDVGAARHANAVASHGFEAAQQLVEQPTQAAAELLQELLVPDQAQRATRVLQALWEGHGGSPTTFPATAPAQAGPLTGEDVELLLGTVETTDMAFWRRIGRDLTLPLIGSLELDDPSANLRQLVTANVGRLAARAVRVLSEPLRIGEPDQLRWMVTRSCLVLRSPEWAAYFATDSQGLPEPKQRPGIDLRLVRDRARRRGLTVAGVEVARPDVEISVKSTVHASVVDLQDVADLEARGQAVVHAALVPLSQTRQLHCDFTTGMAGTQTRATASIAELGRVALGLLVELDEPTWRAVQQMLTSPDAGLDAPRQPMLNGLTELEGGSPPTDGL
jgi:hypothetical protein